MTNQPLPELFLNNMEACTRQAQSLAVSLENIGKIASFTGDYIKNINNDDKQVVDAFVFRFGKLQDMIGNKIFRCILELEAENIRSMLDTLNKMEKFGIIDSVDEWNSIRKIRNDIVHDYDLIPDEVADKLNKIVAFAPKLLEIFKRCGSYAK